MHPYSQYYSTSNVPYDCCGNPRAFNNGGRVHVGVPFNRMPTSECLGGEPCCVAGGAAPCSACPEGSATAAARAHSLEATVSRLLQNQKDLVNEIQALRSQVGAAPKDYPEQPNEELSTHGAAVDLFNLVREFVDLKKREAECHERRGDFQNRRRVMGMPCRARYEPSPTSPTYHYPSMTHVQPPVMSCHMMSQYHHPHIMPQTYGPQYPQQVYAPQVMPSYPPHVLGQQHPCPAMQSAVPCCVAPCTNPPCGCSRGLPCICSRGLPCEAPISEGIKAAPCVPYRAAPENSVATALVPPIPVVAPVVPPMSVLAPVMKAVPNHMGEPEEPRVVVCVEKLVVVDVPPPCECKKDCCTEGCCGGEKCECCKPQKACCGGEKCEGCKPEGTCCGGEKCDCCKPAATCCEGKNCECCKEGGVCCCGEKCDCCKPKKSQTNEGQAK